MSGSDSIIENLDSDTHTLSEEDVARRERRPILIIIGRADDCGQAEAGFLSIAPILPIGRGSRDAPVEPTPTWRPVDRLVSSKHARLRATHDGIELQDLDSTNGTFVNGRPLQGASRITDGDIVFVGGHAAILRLVTKAQSEALQEEASEPFGPIGTASPTLALVSQKLRRLAPSSSEILLVGETGSGKDVYARRIHDASHRAGAFIAINCAAIPRELVESELFGYARGAHSQAVRPKTGLIQQAQGGTLFLDEIGEMPLEAQAKLLRFLQTKTYTPLGATSSVTMDVRVVAATNRAVSSGETAALRADLAARLGAHPVAIPPLRNRIEDVGRLMAHFMKATVRPFQVAAFRALCLYPWPGNIRELEKVISEALLLSRGSERITADHLPETIGRREPPLEKPPVPAPTESRRRRRELPAREVLEELLTRHQGNVAEVARELDRQWAVVWRCIVKYGIQVERFRKA